MAGAAGSRSIGCRDGITTEQRGCGKGRKQFFSSLGILNLGKLGFNYLCPKYRNTVGAGGVGAKIHPVGKNIHLVLGKGVYSWRSRGFGLLILFGSGIFLCIK